MTTPEISLCAFVLGVIVGVLSSLILLRKAARHQPPTPLQRSLSASVASEIRANRMHGILDGWNLAHRDTTRP